MAQVLKDEARLEPVARAGARCRPRWLEQLYLVEAILSLGARRVAFNRCMKELLPIFTPRDYAA